MKMRILLSTFLIFGIGLSSIQAQFTTYDCFPINQSPLVNGVCTGPTGFYESPIITPAFGFAGTQPIMVDCVEDILDTLCKNVFAIDFDEIFIPMVGSMRIYAGFAEEILIDGVPALGTPLTCGTTITINIDAKDDEGYCAGNPTSYDFMIVDDGTPPVFTNLPDTTMIDLTDINGACPLNFNSNPAHYNYIAATQRLEITDPVTGLVIADISLDSLETDEACAGVTYTLNNILVVAGGTTCEQEIELRFKAFDICGNTTTFPDNQSHYLFFKDKVDPELVDPMFNIDETIEACPDYPVLSAFFSYNDVTNTLTYDDGVNTPVNPTSPVESDFTDNCGPVDNILLVKVVGISGSLPCDTTFRLSWLAVDACMNYSDTLRQDITIEDSTPPVFTSFPADDATQNCRPNLDYYMIQLAATDNCVGTAVDTLVSDTDNMGAGCIGDPLIIQRTYTITDKCGNSFSRIQTITVVDDHLPVITQFPADETLSCISEIPAVDLSAVIAEDQAGCSSVPAISHEGTNLVSGSAGCASDPLVYERVYRATDACGNNIEQTQTFTIQDEKAPEFVVDPVDMTVECDGSGNTTQFNNWLATNMNLANITDNCSMVTLDTASTRTYGCFGTTTRVYTFTAKDACDNSTVKTATFKIEDTTAPMFITLATSPTVECESATATPALNTWLANYGNATASDACGGTLNWSKNLVSHTNGGCNGTGSWTYDFFVEDGCGNVATTRGVFTYEDTTDPTFDFMPTTPLTINCEEDRSPASLGVAIASDNCSEIPSVTYKDFTRLTGSCPVIEIVTRIWTIEDECGNTATHRQTINVKDDEAPQLNSAPVGTEDILLSDPNGISHKDVDSLDYVDLGSGCFKVVLGNTANNVFYEYILCAEDNCLSFTTTVDVEIVTDDHCEREFEITWTSKDFCNNTTTYVQNIHVKDVGAPVWTGPNPVLVTANCGEDVNTILRNNYPLAVDNYSTTPRISEVPGTRTTIPGNCPQEETVVATFEVKDDCGNVNPTTAEVRISFEDNEGPVFTADPVHMTKECDGNSNAGELVAWLRSNAGATATDACGGPVSWNANLDIEVVGTCAGTGSWTYEFIASDECGNSTTKVAVFKIEDTTAPTITFCPADVTIECDDDKTPLGTGGSATATDICDLHPIITYDDSSVSGVCPLPVEIITRTWKATDACGNYSTCTQIITVTDDEAPQFVTTPSADVNFLLDDPHGAGPKDITFNSINALGSGCYEAIFTGPGYPNYIVQGPCASDNCNNVTATLNPTITTDADCIREYDIEWTYFDDCNNQIQFTQTVTFTDAVDPAWTSPIPMLLNADCSTNMTTFIANNKPVAVDNSGAPVSVVEDLTMRYDITGNCANEYTRVLFYEASDICGNTNPVLAEVRITVSDNTAPAFGMHTASDETVECDGSGNATARSNWLSSYGGALATDDCSTNLTWSTDLVNTSTNLCAGTGSWEYEFTVTDECGNSNTTTASFIIQDTKDPLITFCPADQTIDCTADNSPNALGFATATDDCDNNVSISYNDVTTPGTCPVKDTIRRTWTATDACGNSSTCLQTILVTDSVDPVVSFNHNSYEEFLSDPLGPCPSDITFQGAFSVQNNCSRSRFTASANGTNYTYEYEGPCASDNCGAVNFTPAVSPMSGPITDGSGCYWEYTIDWTIEDDCGNQVVRSQRFRFYDTAAPAWSSPNPITVQAKCSDDLATLIANNIPTAYDNCQANVSLMSQVMTLGQCITDTTWLLKYEVADDCGNTNPTLSEVVINKVDDDAPVWLIPPSNENVSCSNNNGTDISAWLNSVGGGTAEDPDLCSTVTYSHSLVSVIPGCGNTVTYNYRFTATDACGNSSDIMASYSNTDVEDPVMNSPATDLTVQCDGNNHGLQKAVWLLQRAGMTATDNCGYITWTDAVVSTSGIGTCTETEVYEFIATDGCGNEVRDTASFVVTDTTDPVFTSEPHNMMVECDGSGNVAEFQAWLSSNANSIATDNCATPTITPNAVSTTTPCGVERVYAYTFTAEDDCGNTVTKAAQFSIMDSFAPELHNIPADVTIDCGQTIPAVANVNYTDCNPNTIFNFATNTVNVNSGGVVSVTTRTWTADDGCNPITSESQTITITDSQAPNVVNCPVNIGPIITTGSCTPVQWTAPNFFDNCDNNLTITSTHSPGHCFPVGTTTVIYTATDDGGNSISCSFNVEISNYCGITNTGTQNYIHKFIFNGVENTSGNNNGYADYTNISTNVVPGQYLTVSLIPGSNTGFNTFNYWRAWIDYNNDGDFDDPGENVLQQSGQGALVGLFVVPNNTSVGSVRMRVYMGHQHFMNPCEDHLGFGEAEDYTINVMSSTRPGAIKATDTEATGIANGFIAKKAEDIVSLHWITDTEFKNDHFVIERSKDGNEFRPILTIESMKDKSTDIYYSTKDKSPLRGDGYYRLKQVFMDGTFQYSDVQKVFFGLDADAIEVYPNPSRDFVNIDLSAYAGYEGELVIMNHLSQMVFTKNMDEIGNDALRINVSDFAQGMYHITVRIDGQLVSKKLIVQQ